MHHVHLLLLAGTSAPSIRHIRIMNAHCSYEHCVELSWWRNAPPPRYPPATLFPQPVLFVALLIDIMIINIIIVIAKCMFTEHRSKNCLHPHAYYNYNY